MIRFPKAASIVQDSAFNRINIFIESDFGTTFLTDRLLENTNSLAVQEKVESNV